MAWSADSRFTWLFVLHALPLLFLSIRQSFNFDMLIVHEYMWVFDLIILLRNLWYSLDLRYLLLLSSLKKNLFTLGHIDKVIGIRRWVALSASMGHVNHWLRWLGLHSLSNVYLVLHLQVLFGVLSWVLNIFITCVINVVRLVHDILVVFALYLHAIGFVMSWVDGRIEYLVWVDLLLIDIPSVVFLANSNIFSEVHFFFILAGHVDCCAFWSIIIHLSLLILFIFELTLLFRSVSKRYLPLIHIWLVSMRNEVPWL